MVEKKEQQQQKEEIRDLDEILKLENLEKVGPKTAEALRSMGAYSIMDIAITSPSQLNEKMPSMTLEACKNIILSASRYLAKHEVTKKELKPSNEIYDELMNSERCSTGAPGLDSLLGGGIECGSVTEFYGEFGKGKSQICFSSAVMATQPKDKGGLDGTVLYIDTENTFSAIRIQQIAEAKGFDPIAVHKRILVLRARNTPLLSLFVRDLPRYVKEHGIKMVIVDSVIAPFRAEFIGRGQLADRQQMLGSVLNRLVNVAEVYKLAVIFTNQVLSSPDMFSGADKATGGNVVAHASTHRISLTKRGGNIIARMEDSPRYAKIECAIELTQEGVKDKDVTGTKKKPKLEDILSDDSL